MIARNAEMPAEAKAEGICKSLPYDTELVSINGVSVHFWTGSLEGAALNATLDRAIDAIVSRRDVVRVQYCSGQPAGFWAHEDIP